MELYQKGKQAKDTILRAVNELCDFIKPTYGPANNKILVEKDGRVEAIDDGKTIAEYFELENEFENAVIKFIREVSEMTNRRAGDGTTTSLIFLQAILNKVKDATDQRKVVRELKEGLKEIKEYLLKTSQPISTLAELKKIALTSFNNKEVADLIAQAVFEAGKDGVLITENSTQRNVSYEVVDGIRLPVGLNSPYLVTNEKGEAILDNPHIFVTDKILGSIKDITPLMTAVMKSDKKELLIISGGLEKEALATIVLNKLKGNFRIAAIDFPHMRNMEIGVIAKVVGANFISESLGRTLESVTIEDMGGGKRVISDFKQTTIIGTKGKKEQLESEIADIREKLSRAKNEAETAQYKNTLALLLSKITIIKVGADTESEIDALNYKIEDSLNATQAAFRSGVNKGAGQSYLEIPIRGKIIKEVLSAPHKQIIENIGEGDYSKIYDPTEVLIAAIESAISIACLLIELKGIKVAKPKQNYAQEQALH